MPQNRLELIYVALNTIKKYHQKSIQLWVHKEIKSSKKHHLGNRQKSKILNQNEINLKELIKKTENFY